MGRHPFDLSGRLAVVTGVNRGIGAEIALALARAGADIVGVSRSPGADSHVAGLVRAVGRTYRSEQADLADRTSMASCAGRLADMGRPVDILINNAGIVRRAPAERHADALWDETISVNLSAQFMLAREIGRGMIARRAGKIVFLASMQSFTGGVDIVSYAAAKSGIGGVVRALANEWAAHGVNANAIAPGYIETDMTHVRHADSVLRKEVEARIPAGRWGTPADIGGAVVFLAAPASDYVHGIVLPVDGGWLVR